MNKKMIKNGQIRSLNDYYLENFKKMVFELGERKTAEILHTNRMTINLLLELKPYEQVSIKLVRILEKIVIYVEENME